MSKYLSIILALALFSCHKPSSKNQEALEETPTGTIQASKVRQEITSASGLKYIDEIIGTGNVPKVGDKVKVHYTGTLEDGTKFDSSLDRGKPFTFELGARQVIQGWDRGVRGMQVGGIRKLTIPPELAYGDRAVGGGLIPANSTLVFEVKLLEITR